jgi:hypothetical protein
MNQFAMNQFAMNQFITKESQSKVAANKSWFTVYILKQDVCVKHKLHPYFQKINK